MKGMTHDMRLGLTAAVLASIAFGFSGTFASGLLDSGWSPAAVVVVRVLLGGTVLALPAYVALRGRFSLLRAEAPLVLSYGVICVGFTQLAYFSAVDHMEVGIALLIEYAAPVVVLGWLWLRHGERPGRTTLLGAAVAIAGLVLVLDLLGGASLSGIGVAWAIGAMIGCAIYFVLSARASALPPVALACAGLYVGGLVLLLAAAVGILDLDAGTDPSVFRGTEVAWWLPVLGLGVVTAALAFVLGIAASRLLGSRMASFVALLEVVAALVVAWLLLGEAPGPVQFLGGLLILGGVVLVKLGEPAPVAPADDDTGLPAALPV
jgi:drug/metabolite transporter (DMT)-like permease